MTRRPPIAHALAWIALVVLVACSAGPADPPTGPLLPSVRDALPQMDAPTFAALLAQQRGTPVVVNFWAAWCVPCTQEAPDLAAAANRYRGAVRFIGVDMQDDRAGATDFIRRFDLPYPSVFDPTNAIGLTYDLYAPPATLFYDADGNLVRTVPGQISAEDLVQGLRQITAPGA